MVGSGASGAGARSRSITLPPDAFAAVLAAGTMGAGLAGMEQTLAASIAAGAEAVRQRGAHVRLPTGLLPPPEPQLRKPPRDRCHHLGCILPRATVPAR